jgi:hypothetical protein
MVVAAPSATTARIDEKTTSDTTPAKHGFTIKANTQILLIKPYHRGFEDLDNCQKLCGSDPKCLGFEIFGQCRLYSDTPQSLFPAKDWTVGIKVVQ